MKIKKGKRGESDDEGEDYWRHLTYINSNLIILL